VLVDIFAVTDYNRVKFLGMSGLKVFSKHVVNNVSEFSLLLDLNGRVFDFKVGDVFFGS
jgi:hypothetical protein